MPTSAGVGRGSGLSGRHSDTSTTPGGTSPTSSADRYTYDATPTVTGVSPNGGPINGGDTVTITGTNFVSGATVHFGTKAGTSVNVPSSTTLTTVAPAGGDGTVDVTVSTPGGSSATSGRSRTRSSTQCRVLATREVDGDR